MSRPRSRRWTFLAIALAIGVGLPFGAAELWLRALEGPNPMRWGWRDPYALAGQRPAAEVNEFGYRGRPIRYADEDFVVVLVGDSQVQADACAFDAMPERRLEAHLQALMARPVRVFTVGALGYGTDQQCLALEEYLARHRADLVVAWITPGNDLRENLLPVAPVPKPTFWLDGEGRLQGPTARIGDPVPHGLRVLQHLGDILLGPLNQRWFARVLPPPGPPVAAGADPVRTDWGVISHLGDDMPNEITNVIVQLDPPSPRARYAVDLARALLLRMQGLARARGARFAGLLDERPDFPLSDGVYEVELAGVRHRVRLSRAAYEANITRLIDGLGFVRVPVTTRPFVAGAKDPHLNAAAVDEVMQTLATALVR